MIPKYRNQGIILLFSGIGLMILAVGTYGICLNNDLRRLGECLGVIIMLFAVILYQWGGITLAKAKGYSSDVPAGVITVGLLCCGFIFFITPFVVLFLKDKTRHRGGHRPLSGRDRKTMMLSIWSLSLSSLGWITLFCAASVPALHTQAKDVVTQLVIVTISSILMIVVIASVVLAITALRRRGPRGELAMISIGLTAVLLLILLMGALMAALEHQTLR